MNDQKWLEELADELTKDARKKLFQAFERGKNVEWSQATWAERSQQVTDYFKKKADEAASAFVRADEPKTQRKVGIKQSSKIRRMHVKNEVVLKKWHDIAVEIGFDNNTGELVAVLSALSGLTWPVEDDEHLYDNTLLMHPLVNGRRVARTRITELELDGRWPPRWGELIDYDMGVATDGSVLVMDGQMEEI